MFAPANQSAFNLTLDGVASDLKVYSFKGEEALSRPYCFDLELVSEQPDIDLEGLLHRQVYLGFNDQGRGVHGLVYRVAQGDWGRRLTRYQISLVPQLAYLSHSTHQRIFQHNTVPQIIEQVGGEILPVFQRYPINGQSLSITSGPAAAAKASPWWRGPTPLLAHLAELSPQTLIDNLLQGLEEQRPDLYAAFTPTTLRRKVVWFARAPDISPVALADYLASELS